MMVDNASPLSVIDAALPQVQQALRKELADLVASGATVGRVENDEIMDCGSDVPYLKARREALIQSLAKEQPFLKGEFTVYFSNDVIINEEPNLDVFDVCFDLTDFNMKNYIVHAAAKPTLSGPFEEFVIDLIKNGKNKNIVGYVSLGYHNQPIENQSWPASWIFGGVSEQKGPSRRRKRAVTHIKTV
jgi:hypothetical protein